MGPGHDRLAVVDERLRVRGVEGLVIADASVMPTLVSANTYAATLMIAEKASDMILGRPPLAALDEKGAMDRLVVRQTANHQD